MFGKVTSTTTSLESSLDLIDYYRYSSSSSWRLSAVASTGICFIFPFLWWLVTREDVCSWQSQKPVSSGSLLYDLMKHKWLTGVYHSRMTLLSVFCSGQPPQKLLAKSNTELLFHCAHNTLPLYFYFLFYQERITVSSVVEDCSISSNVSLISAVHESWKL